MVTSAAAAPKATASISGRITSAVTHDWVAGATVVAFVPGDTFATASAVTSADGGYVIHGLDPQQSSTYFVCVNTSYTQQPRDPSGFGYLSRCYRNVPWNPYFQAPPPQTAHPVPVTSGRTTTGINLALPRGAALTGRTVARKDGSPVRNVLVEILTSPPPGNGLTVASTTSNGSGTWRVQGVKPAAAYVVCFITDNAQPAAPGYGDQCYRNQPWHGPPNAIPAGTTTVPAQAGVVTGGITARLVSTTA